MATDPGYDQPPKKSKTLWYVLGGIGAVVVLGCLGCGGCVGISWWQVSKVSRQVDSEPGISVQAEAVSKAYKDNAASADSQYQAKVVQVTGVVSKVISPAEIELVGTAGGDNIRCQGDLSNLTLFQNVSAGQTVTVKGYCTGKPLGYIQVSTCKSVTKK